MTKRRKKALGTLLAGLLGLLFAWLQQQGYVEPAYKQAVESQPGQYRVIRVVDGDTITIDVHGTDETIRLIGVDTPETNDPRKEVQCFGSAATDFTKKLIGKNTVRLQSDPTNTNRDRYNRLLRYVYLPNNQLVNAEIIKQGYGFAYTSFPFEKLNEFKQYQKQAEENNLGLWQQCDVTSEESGQTYTNPE